MKIVENKVMYLDFRCLVKYVETMQYMSIEIVMSLIVLISNGTSTNTPNADFMWKDKGKDASKYDYDKAFPNGSIVDCGEFILSDMEKLLREEIKKLTD